MATFIDGVNRLFRVNWIIKGDDDTITTFSDTQHAADIELAKIAIQDELAEVISDRLIPYEKTSSTISLVNGTRTYTLASDFIRFYGSNPAFYDSTDNNRIYQIKGGEDALKDIDYQYKTATGSPNGWYWENVTVIGSNTKKVAFWYVPDSSYNGRSLSYDYEASVMVENSSDTMPFYSNEEFYSFVSMAARRFQFMRSEQPLGELTRDPTYANAKARLYNLLRLDNPPNQYGKHYG